MGGFSPFLLTDLLSHLIRLLVSNWIEGSADERFKHKHIPQYIYISRSPLNKYDSLPGMIYTLTDDLTFKGRRVRHGKNLWVLFRVILFPPTSIFMFSDLTECLCRAPRMLIFSIRFPIQVVAKSFSSPCDFQMQAYQFSLSLLKSFLFLETAWGLQTCFLCLLLPIFQFRIFFHCLPWYIYLAL